MSRHCIVCEQEGKPAVYRDSSLYVQCTNCDLIYVDKLLSSNELYTAYNGGFFKDCRRKITMPFRKIEGVKNYSKSLERARQITAFCHDNLETNENIRFLDIGCNKGFLLLAGQELGWDVYGEELVPELIIPITNSFPKLKGHVFGGRFCDIEKDLESKSFDLITAIDVVEHFEDPLSDLKAIHRILKDNGRVVMQTPDIACDRAKAEGTSWGALKDREHLHLFDCSNLGALAKKAGFSSFECHPAFEEADGNFVIVFKK